MPQQHECPKCVTCDSCGTRYCIGDSPVCKGGHTRPLEHRPFVPYVDEHISETPTLITSHRQRTQLLRRNKMDFRSRKVGMPGCEV